MTRSTSRSTKRVAGRQGKKTAQGKTPVKLLVAMTGKASAAKAATGDKPVFASGAASEDPARSGSSRRHRSPRCSVSEQFYSGLGEPFDIRIVKGGCVR